MRSLVAVDSNDLATLQCPWCGRPAPRSAFGFKVVRDGEVIGLATCSPADQLGGLYPVASVVITQLWVRPDDVGELVGSQLVQRAAAVVVGTRRLRYLVAGGTHGPSDCRHLPARFLAALGFTESVPGVQWRLDLRRTARVKQAMRSASALMGRLLDGRRPAPAGRTTRGVPPSPSSPH